jgi:hypothetical protein
LSSLSKTTVKPTRSCQPKEALKRSEIELSDLFGEDFQSCTDDRLLDGSASRSSKSWCLILHPANAVRRSSWCRESRGTRRTKRNERERWGRTEALFRASPVERYRGHRHMAASEYRSDQWRQERWFHRFGFRSLVLPSHSPPSAVSLRRLVSSTGYLSRVNLSQLSSPSRL